MSNHYETLGVPTDADSDLIKATYRALLKIYHPDVYKGKKPFAERKIKEITEAYQILIDPKKRSKYDQKIADGADSHFEDETNDPAFTSYQEQVQADWDFAKSYYPEIEGYYASLAKLNRRLAFQFKLFCVEARLFDHAREIAHKLEQDFFVRYFGKNEELQALVKSAILAGNAIIPKEANKAIKILGDGAAERVLAMLRDRFAGEFPGVQGSGFYKGYSYETDPKTGMIKITSQPAFHTLKSTIGLEFSNEGQMRFMINQCLDTLRYMNEDRSQS